MTRIPVRCPEQGMASRKVRVLQVRACLGALLVPLFCVGGAQQAAGQISFTSAVTLALQNSPRVVRAHDDLDRAAASLTETRDAFVPVLGIGGGVGRSYGITLTVPTIFTVNAQSLIFSYSQHDYIRSARLGVQAATLGLEDVREQVEEDAAITYLNLDEALLRYAAVMEQSQYATRLVAVTQDRVDVGLEDKLELKRSMRSEVQTHLQQLQFEDQISALKEHLHRLMGLPADSIQTISASIPPPPAISDYPAASSPQETSSLRSAEANASARLEQAFGDNRYSHRPQLIFEAQYGRISPVNDVSAYYNLNGKYNTFEAGVLLSFPLLDRARDARGRESMIDAVRVRHDAEIFRGQQREDRLRLEHSILELSTRAKLADLDRGIAQDQLEAMLVEVHSRSDSVTGRQMNVKDELAARIEERQRYIEVLDATLQLSTAKISLLRQTGALEAWLRGIPSR